MQGDFFFETLPSIENDATLCYLLPLLSVQTPAEGLNPAQQLSTSLTEPPPIPSNSSNIVTLFQNQI